MTRTPDIKTTWVNDKGSLIGHNDVVEMLHEPIYIPKKKKTLILNQIEPKNWLENKNI